MTEESPWQIIAEMEDAIPLDGGDEGVRIHGEFVEEENERVPICLIEKRHRRDKYRLRGCCPPNELCGCSCDCAIEKAVWCVFERKYATERKITQIKDIFDLDMQVIHSACNRAETNVFGPFHPLGCTFAEVPRELGNGDAMVARKVESGFALGIPAVVPPPTSVLKIEDIVGGPIGNMPTRGAAP